MTTALFIVACALIVGSTVIEHPADSGVGLATRAAGLPAYLFWSRRRA